MLPDGRGRRTLDIGAVSDETKDKPAEDGEDLAELMYVKCAYCGKWMDVKPGHLHWVSHGLCDDCLKKEMERIQTMFPGGEGKKPDDQPKS